MGPNTPWADLAQDELNRGLSVQRAEWQHSARYYEREKAYSIKDLKEYIPNYEGRAQYVAERNKSEFRRNLYDVIQATKLLNLVIERHPNTPWADLAQEELRRGLSVQRHEWQHSPRFYAREKLVPKY